MTEVHATFCSRMQAAERGQSQLKRRLQKALRALDYSVPAQVWLHHCCAWHRCLGMPAQGCRGL